MNLNSNNPAREYDYKQLVQIIKNKNNKKITKIKLFDLLSEFTYKYYNIELGDIKRVFKTPISTIQNWDYYITNRESNNGKDIEKVLINYSISKNVESHSIRGKGTDANIGGKHVEIKSSTVSKIVTMLQTSFYKNDPNKFYAFVTNTSKPNIDIRIISSQLLYQLSLGDNIVKEINDLGYSPLLLDQIETGLEKLDFPHLIQTSLITGESANSSKSFIVGNDIRIRFEIKIEPK